jgi:hypothetical protein
MLPLNDNVCNIFSSKKLSIFWNHWRGACLSPYKAWNSLQTRCSFLETSYGPWLLHVNFTMRECLFRNVVFTSKFQPFDHAKALIAFMVFHFATIANVFPKSTHVFYSHPLAINLVLYHSTSPFIPSFFLNKSICM